MTALSAALGWAAPNLVRALQPPNPSLFSCMSYVCVSNKPSSPLQFDPRLLQSQISKSLTHYLAVGLFFFFGLRSLYESIFAWDGGGGESELAEVEAELGGGLGGNDDKNKKAEKSGRWRKALTAGGVISPVFLETFIITFLAEWGDRSQIATIGLAASSDPYGVTLGGIIGHALCTGAAVIGGRHMATRISERAVAICGGVLFVIFGVHSLLSGVDD